MKTIEQLLEIKGHQIFSVAPNTSVLEALKQMDEHDLESLLVLEGERLVGIVTEADYTRKIALKGRSPKHFLVKDIMSKQVITATPKMRSSECIEIMIRNDIQLLPVVDGACVVGIITLPDAVKSTLFHQQDTIRFLEDMMLMDLETA